MGLLQILENDAFTKDDAEKKSCPKWKDESFVLLENWIRHQYRNKDGAAVLRLARTNDGKDQVRSGSYVGTICLRNGDILEIYPKITTIDNGVEKQKIEQSKNLLIRMLSVVGDIPFKNTGTSFSGISRTPLLEFYINAFISNLNILVKQGLKLNYNETEENLNVCKGRICFQKNITENAVHKERFYVQFDELNNNCAENRIIKATLIFLKKICKSNRFYTPIKSLLVSFDSVNASTDYERDFGICSKNRDAENYRKIIQWCRLFLHMQSFDTYSGEVESVALLFNMNELFERYIARLMLKEYSDKYDVYIQDSHYTLFSADSEKNFHLRPDIVLQNSDDSKIFDTKWKIIDNPSDIAQTDMYQMYAYQNRYQEETGHCSTVTLLYPKIKNVTSSFPDYINTAGGKICVRFIDMTSDDPIRGLLL